MPWAQRHGQKALPPTQGSFQGAAHRPVQSQGTDSGLQNRSLWPHTSGPRPPELEEEGVTGERFGGTPAWP